MPCHFRRLLRREQEEQDSGRGMKLDAAYWLLHRAWRQPELVLKEQDLWTPPHNAAFASRGRETRNT